jgi:hypothetical protein
LPSGKILVSDMQTGLYVFAPVDPALQTGPAPDVQGMVTAAVFPQPAADRFALAWTADRPLVGRFGLWDAQGRQVSDWGTQALPAGRSVRSFDLPAGLPAGVYLLRGILDNGAQAAVVAKVVVVPH